MNEEFDPNQALALAAAWSAAGYDAPPEPEPPAPQAPPQHAGESEPPAATLEAPIAERFFYDGKRYLLDVGNDFVPMDRASCKSHLKSAFVDEPESAICEIQTARFVTYAGPIAGHRRGLHRADGKRLLATSSPKFPTIRSSSPMGCPTITEFINELFQDETQLEIFFGWLKTARSAVLAGKHRPGQALCLAGPISCGKSRLIQDIIAPALGGRTGSPFQYLSGKTAFNSDLLGAELLVIDDEAGSHRIEERRKLGDGVKSLIYAGQAQISAKFKESFSFRPVWRIVIACNDSPEALRVLPPIGSDLEDKISVLRCWPAVLPSVDFDAWQSAIRAELPAFVAAVDAHTIRPEHRDARSGVIAWRNPELMNSLAELDPETQLLALIDQCAASGGISLPWSGTAAQLRALLAVCGTTKHDAEKLLGAWQPACGVYLGRLTTTGRVKNAGKVDNTIVWEIEPLLKW